MKRENIKVQMRKGMLEYCILLLIMRKEVYASDIVKFFSENELILVEGTVYPLLTRLKNDQMVAYRWVESPQGPPRKYYMLTPNGEELLAKYDEAWGELNEIILKIKNDDINFS